MEELQQEKKKVKNELKQYDQAFLNKFIRLPNRHEKEPMRHIYMYYKKLKQAIVKNQTIGGATSSSSGGMRSSSAGAGSSAGRSNPRNGMIGGV